jgi:hypothetical protein
MSTSKVVVGAVLALGTAFGFGLSLNNDHTVTHTVTKTVHAPAIIKTQTVTKTVGVPQPPPEPCRLAADYVDQIIDNLKAASSTGDALHQNELLTHPTVDQLTRRLRLVDKLDTLSVTAQELLPSLTAEQDECAREIADK